jgi:hypothetical protein
MPSPSRSSSASPASAVRGRTLRILEALVRYGANALDPARDELYRRIATLHPAEPQGKGKMPHEITHRENPRRRAMLETKMRYDVMLSGARVGELRYSMRSYFGYLPCPVVRNST